MSPAADGNSSMQKPDWTVVEMLEWATGYFEDKNVPSPRLSIEWLLAHVLQVKRLDLYLQFDRPLTRPELDSLKPLVQRRARHEPLQYITGSTDFYNLTLAVTPDVLIPRPETEQLVDLILQEHPRDKKRRVLDIGTGSGCIALALKKARPDWIITGMDISEAALEIARSNADNESLEVTFHRGDLSSYRPGGKIDIIVSNPPYVHKHETEDLEKQVAAFEPLTALVTDDVSGIYSKLLSLCRESLSPEGRFYFEINESDGDEIADLCRSASFRSRLLKDDAGKHRFVAGSF
ncbi:peptide chain release factor N(5)-glutamine methyltransferase [Natronogracilivirga saccharolytica]